MSEPHDLVLFAHLARKPDSELDLERAALLVAESGSAASWLVMTQTPLPCACTCRPTAIPQERMPQESSIRRAMTPIFSLPDKAYAFWNGA